MVRRTDYNGQTKTIAAAAQQTIVWTASEIASERVVAYHFVFSGAAGNDLSAVDRIRISANGSVIVNISALQLRSFWQFMSGGRIKPGATDEVFTVPLCLLDAPTIDMQDVSQFPFRSQVQVDLVLNATTVAGSVVMGWTETNMQPQVFPRLLSSSMNIPASTSLQRFNFQENGIIRGIGLSQTGIDRAKFALGNEEFTKLPGEEFQATAGFGNMLLEAESLYGNGVASAGTPLVTHAFSRITAGISAPVDGSFVELQTGAGWGGVSEEVTLYSVAPNGPAAANR